MLERFIHPPLTPEQFQEPRWARFLFASQAAAWVWPVARRYLTFVWLPAGWGKITSGRWLFGDGAPVAGLVGPAIADPGTPPCYASFLEGVMQPNAAVFATLVPFRPTARRRGNAGSH
jgi:hypothetical protein